MALFELGAEEGDSECQLEAAEGLDAVEQAVQRLELARMLGGEHDAEHAFIDINAGAGGTEACDWAEMLLRMYLRWAERRGFRTELMECTPGEEAGIKSATLSVKGEYAYGLLKAETGIHRLVRKSPFDSGNRRHTSFASVLPTRTSSAISRWKSMREMCGWIPTGPQGPVDSMSTRRTRPYG